MPPELLFLLLDALGGSYTATAADLLRYDPSKDAMEVITKYDPIMKQIRFTDSENRREPTPNLPPPDLISINAQSVTISQGSFSSKKLSHLPLFPTQGWRVETGSGRFYYWSTVIKRVPYSGWWSISTMPAIEEHIQYLKYTPDGRRIEND